MEAKRSFDHYQIALSLDDNKLIVTIQDILTDVFFRKVISSSNTRDAVNWYCGFTSSSF